MFVVESGVVGGVASCDDIGLYRVGVRDGCGICRFRRHAVPGVIAIFVRFLMHQVFIWRDGLALDVGC